MKVKNGDPINMETLAALVSERDRLAAENATMQKVIDLANGNIGAWLSAALDDPGTCDEFRRDVAEFFNALDGKEDA